MQKNVLIIIYIIIILQFFKYLNKILYNNQNNKNQKKEINLKKGLCEGQFDWPLFILRFAF